MAGSPGRRKRSSGHRKQGSMVRLTWRHCPLGWHSLKTSGRWDCDWFANGACAHGDGNERGRCGDEASSVKTTP
jgi:hypothetical protein